MFCCYGCFIKHLILRLPRSPVSTSTVKNLGEYVDMFLVLLRVR